MSVSLTAITSFLSPFLLPLFFLFYLAQTQFIDAAHHFTIPILPTMLQLMLVTILPLGLGMMTRQFAPDFAQRVQPWVKKGASMAMVIIVLSLIVTNQSVMKGVITSTGLAVIVMAFIAFVCGYGISKAAGLESSQRRTLAIEVGIQNAGTAMMVALTLLQQPELAFVPLMYGILMNVPAFAFAIWANMKTSSAGMSQTKMG